MDEVPKKKWSWTVIHKLVSTSYTKYVHPWGLNTYGRLLIKKKQSESPTSSSMDNFYEQIEML